MKRARYQFESLDINWNKIIALKKKENGSFLKSDNISKKSTDVSVVFCKTPIWYNEINEHTSIIKTCS